MLDLSKISNIGHDYSQYDKLLLDAFIAGDAIQRIMDEDAFLIIGNKGAGKTAIRRRLEEKAPQLKNKYVVIREFPQFPIAALGDPSLTEIQRRELNPIRWKILLLLITLRGVNENRNYPHISKKSQKKLADAASIFDSIGLDVAQLFSWEGLRKILEALKRVQVGTENIFSVRPRSYLEELKWLSYLRTTLERVCLDHLRPECSHLVFIDEFDELAGFYEASMRKVCHEVFETLILAAEALRKDCEVADVNGQTKRDRNFLKVVLAVRADIYDAMRSPHELRLENFAERIKWTERDLPLSLERMIVSRFEVAAGKPKGSLSCDDIFERGSADLEYILQRSMLRPRNVIVFANKALDEWRRSAASAKSDSKISMKDILVAETAYSSYVAKEFNAYYEFSKRFRTTGYDLLEPLKRVPGKSFGYDEFLTIIATYGGHPDSAKAEVRNEADLVLTDLFDAGCIGLQRVGGASGGTRTTWKFEEPSAVFGKATKYAVHPALYRACGITT